VNATSIRCSLHDAVRLRKPRSRRVPEMTTVGRKARLRGVMGAARRAAAFRALGNAGNSQLPRTHPSLRFFKRDSCVGQANKAGSNPQVAVHVAWGAANRCRRCLKLVPGRLGNGGKHAGSSGPPCARSSGCRGTFTGCVRPVPVAWAEGGVAGKQGLTEG